METISPSEPLLSEASYFIMTWKSSSFDAVEAFKFIHEGFAIHKGDRGEFLTMLLMMLARDKAVGPPTNNGRPDRRFFHLASFVDGKLFKSSSRFLGNSFGIENVGEGFSKCDDALQPLH